MAENVRDSSVSAFHLCFGIIDSLYHIPGFCVGSGGSSSGPHFCTVSTFMKPSPQTRRSYFKLLVLFIFSWLHYFGPKVRKNKMVNWK